MKAWSFFLGQLQVLSLQNPKPPEHSTQLFSPVACFLCGFLISQESVNVSKQFIKCIKVKSDTKALLFLLSQDFSPSDMSCLASNASNSFLILTFFFPFRFWSGFGRSVGLIKASLAYKSSLNASSMRKRPHLSYLWLFPLEQCLVPKAKKKQTKQKQDPQ